jgi:oligopeptide transport system substrate-binding protein
VENFKEETVIMKRKVTLLALTTLLVLGLATESFAFFGFGKKKKAKVNEEVIITLNNSSEPGSLHPALSKGTHDSWPMNHMYEGLLKIGKDGMAVPGQAESWTVSEDGRTYTFTLKDGIKWSNGEAVTAHDFEYSWKHVIKPETASDYVYQMYYIQGAYEANAENASMDDVAIKALDDKTLEVTLVEPAPYFLELTAFYTYYPVNKKLQESNPDWFKDPATIVTNGLFKLVEWNHKENIKLRKNEHYYAIDEVKYDGIDFVMIEDQNTAWQMYRSDELDMVIDLPTDVVGAGHEDLVIGNELATYYYRFNVTKKPFNNAKVRRALAMAIDRETITRDVMQGGQKPALAYVPFGILTEEGDYRGIKPHLFEENVDEAKKLLAEGLAEEGMDKLSFVLLYNTSEGHKRVAEAIQEMWRNNLGVEISLENVEFQIKIDREDKLDYDMSRAGWIGDYVDPMTFMDMMVTDGGNNDTGWSNTEFDSLITKAKSTADNSVRFPNGKSRRNSYERNASNAYLLLHKTIHS